MSHSAPRKDAGTRLPDPDTVSAFHQGERSIQRRLGVREKIESWGQRGLRDYMLEQHREFFEQLEYFFVGTVDTQQRPWASLLTGEPGFLRSPDPETLCVSVELQRGDPLAENLKDGIRIGGLGIQLHSRRRNRVNGTVTMQQGGFAVRVHQSFGNCAQYIQARRHRRLPPTSDEPQTARTMTALDAAARTIIARADTFFIASAYVSDPADRRHGVDVSHRGGPPGFVLVEDERTLLWPDYRGNFFFNTLGNIWLDPHCGLLFLDFDSGDALQLTGRAEIVWEVAQSAPQHLGAQRLIRLRVNEGLYLPRAVPFSWDLLGYAPQFPDLASGVASRP